MYPKENTTLLGLFASKKAWYTDAQSSMDQTDVLCSLMEGMTAHCCETELDTLKLIYVTMRDHVRGANAAPPDLIILGRGCFRHYARSLKLKSRTHTSILHACCESRNDEEFCMLAHFLCAVFLAELYLCRVTDIDSLL